jgi:hypothetical protein
MLAETFEIPTVACGGATCSGLVARDWHEGVHESLVTESLLAVTSDRRVGPPSREFTMTNQLIG